MLRKIFFMAVLAAGLSGLAFAQRGGGGGGMGGEGVMGGEGGGSRGGDSMGGGMGGMRSSTTRLDRMNDVLKLNKDQKKEVKNILDEGQKEANPLKEQMTKARLSIAEAEESGKSAEELKGALNAYAALEFQMTELELKSFVGIYKSLDKDQQAKAGVVYQLMAGIFKGKNWNE